jgi:hypothetical protein
VGGYYHLSFKFWMVKRGEERKSAYKNDIFRLAQKLLYSVEERKVIFLSRTVVNNGSIVDNYAQIIANPLFKKIVKEYVEKFSLGHPDFVSKFSKSGKGKVKYDDIMNFLYDLTLKPIKKDTFDKSVLYDFIEGLYDFWRKKHRFIVKRERYVKSLESRLNAMKSAEFVGETFEKTVRNFYRSLENNIHGRSEKILRQISSGAQAIFVVDKSRIKKEKRMNYDWMYSVPFIWSVIYEPPVIFYTNSNKRKGVFPVVNKKILGDVELTKNWYALPLHVGNLLIYVYVNAENLCHAAGLANLYEMASPAELRKPDGLVLFGLPYKKVGKEYTNGVVFKDELYTGVIPQLDQNDYFGYAKKILLTVHNLIMIDRFKLPIHGSLAYIKLKNGKSATAMFMGDSGAGKSETLDALGRLPEISELRVIIDDMGSLDIKNDKVVAYGTETGAYVRLDDLPPGYAYSNIDRSIFMNPDQTNARVIVPYGNFDEITTPTPIDFFFYANNYTSVDSDEDRVIFFENPKNAIAVFSQGARMAKGTTAEKGMSYSYFANPFGAIQKREVHEKIAEHYVNKMFESGVRVGEIRTMLGIEGYEKDGPHLAAKRLLKVISNL